MTDLEPVASVPSVDVPELVRLSYAATRFGAEGLEMRPNWARNGAFLRLWVRDVVAANGFRRCAEDLGFVVSLMARHPDGGGHDGYQMCVVVPPSVLRAARLWAVTTGQSLELGSV